MIVTKLSQLGPREELNKVIPDHLCISIIDSPLNSIGIVQGRHTPNDVEHDPCQVVKGIDWDICHVFLGQIHEATRSLDTKVVECSSVDIVWVNIVIIQYVMNDVVI